VRRLAALAVSLAVTGCVAGPAPRDHFYRLEVDPPKAQSRPPQSGTGHAGTLLEGTLRVDRLRTDALTGERRLLVRDASGGAEVHPQRYDYWIDSPGLLVRDALATFLRAAGVATRVVGAELRVREDYVITGRLLRLETLRGTGRVAAEIEVALTRTSDRELLLLSTYLEEAATPGDSTAGAARAMGQAVSQIFERLLADMAALRVGAD
jgi:ABC-type uncharacterized transport system auxiliary subunit